MASIQLRCVLCLQVVIVFLPFLPIKIGDALMVTMALDAAGAVLGWRRFDHFGHLGGQPRAQTPLSNSIQLGVIVFRECSIHQMCCPSILIIASTDLHNALHGWKLCLVSFGRVLAKIKGLL